MSRCLNIQRKTRIIFLVLICAAGTVAASMVSRPSGVEKAIVTHRARRMGVRAKYE